LEDGIQKKSIWGTKYFNRGIREFDRKLPRGTRPLGGAYGEEARRRNLYEGEEGTRKTGRARIV